MYIYMYVYIYIYMIHVYIYIYICVCTNVQSTICKRFTHVFSFFLAFHGSWSLSQHHKNSTGRCTIRYCTSPWGKKVAWWPSLISQLMRLISCIPNLWVRSWFFVCTPAVPSAILPRHHHAFPTPPQFPLASAPEAAKKAAMDSWIPMGMWCANLKALKNHDFIMKTPTNSVLW